VKRLKLYALAITIAAALSAVLCSVYAMPAFTLAASPGVALGLMAAGNTPENNNVIIFLGNWFFYSLAFVVCTEIVLIFRRGRGR
jgi:uncharacterized membrane protein YwaF